MSRNQLLSTSMFVFAVVSLAAMQEPQPAPAAATARERALGQLRQLDWLAGTWVLQDGKVATEEHWRPLQGTTMLGTSHSYDAARTHFFEFLRLAIERDQVVYVAMPGGAPATTFALAQLTDDAVVFENAAHDHPQRIRYQRTERGITATIGQFDGSRARSFVFTAK